MGDDITIGVTEIVNNIEVTAQPNDQIVDISVIDNADDVTLNITPTVIEININKGSSYAKWGDILGTLSDQTDLQNALDLKANLVGGKVPASELPSYVDDIIEVANYAALPATGETGKIYVTLDNNKIYRWSGSIYIEIAANNAIWGAITGTLSNQTDLQNALNAKFDDPTGDITQYIAGDGSLITFPVAGQSGTLVREVRNTTGATLLKGTVVYINGATGNKPTIAKALATGDSTSAQTFGLLQADMPNNTNGYVVCVGDIIGLDTSAITEGTQLYLSSTTAGAYTSTKQVAPAHLVYIGVVTRSHPTLGQIEVKIQNGYELDEIHDVAISSKTNNQFLVYESASDLWKNKSLGTVLGGTSSQFVKGDGSLDSSTYLTSLSGAVLTTTDQTVNGVKKFTDFLSTDKAYNQKIISGGYLPDAGYSSIFQNDRQITFLQFNAAATAVTQFSFIYPTSNTNQFYYVPNASGTLALTSDLHSAVTIGTANGLSLSGQALSLALASGSANGALSSTDWNTFNNKQNALSGTGFVKISGTTISYDNTSYLPLTGGTLSGALYGTIANFTQSALQTSLYAYNGKVGGEGLSSGAANGTAAYLANNSTTYPVLSLVGLQSTKLIEGRNTNDAISFSVSSAGVVTGSSFVKSGGTSSQFLKADGSIDSTTYQTALTNPVTGTGTTNYLPKFTGTSAIGNSLIYDNGTNVGIGTTSPSYPLDVVSNSNAFGINIRARINNDYGVLSFSNYNASEIISQIYIHRTGTNIGALIFETNNGSTASEKMRITSGGNVGIGTTSPAQKLDVIGIIRASSDFEQTGNSVFKNTSYDMYLQTDAAGAGIIFRTSGASERMRITSGGNVGIGTTSPGTASANTILGFVNGSNIQARTALPQIAISSNIDGDWYAPTYKTSNFASQIFIDGNGGTIGIRTAASGTAGGAITWNNGLRMDSSGNVGIGTTSPSGLLHLQGNTTNPVTQVIDNLNAGTSAGTRISFRYQGTETGYIYNRFNGGDFNTDIGSSDYMRFLTGGSERMRITSGGLVGIGTSNPTRSFQISRTSTFFMNAEGSIVAAGSSDTEFRLFGNNVETMTLKSGQVGIGTTSPSYQLQLSTDSAAKPTSALWTIASDERIKENINSYTKGLNELLKINPITYDYNGLGGFKKGKGGVGIIAQEIAEILPDSVSSIKGKLNETDEEEIDILNFNGHELTYILINAVKELKAEIEILKNK